MAILSPTLQDIQLRRQKPTEGEIALVTFLANALDDSYEVFFQPFINGDRPDIVLVRRDSGVLIVEVKDWELQHYYLDRKGRWHLSAKRALIKSPLAQVLEYKENLYNLHIDRLLEYQIKNPKYWAIVGCAVYFHNATEWDLYNFLTKGFALEIKALDKTWYRRYVAFIHHFGILGYDSLNKGRLQELLARFRLNKKSSLFNLDLYKSFKRYLQPPYHDEHVGKTIVFTGKQKRLIVSRPEKKKVKGCVGSGKTVVLAHRAVNAHKRTGETVLILTFNITLRNYVHDKISEVRQNFSWEYFYITNYHEFIIRELNNLGIHVEIPDSISANAHSEYLDQQYFSNVSLFEQYRHLTRKFQSVFIDEIQDYKIQWIKIVQTCFLKPEGELVVFGDEKQNIYRRPLDQNRSPWTGIPGAWNILDDSFRLSRSIAQIAMMFQRRYLYGRYDMETISVQTSIFDTDSTAEYHFLQSPQLLTICNIIFSTIERLQVHPNDICILGSRIDLLRELDYYIRSNKREKTLTMFETKEIFDKVRSDLEKTYGMASGTVNKQLNLRVQQIRKNKKLHFWMNYGTLKLATIHSFKGWEIPTLFLLLENEKQVTDELVYTALTRCKRNLIVINLGNLRYHPFFSKHLNTEILRQAVRERTS